MASYRHKIALALYRGVVNYFRSYPPVASALYEEKKIRHYAVLKGDTLSHIAAQFSTSIVAIKKANQLSSSQLRIGQQLLIPPMQA